jgi:hypothetical protein
MLELPTESMPDHDGEPYLTVLGRLHRVLAPKSYFEIGTNTGDSLKLAACPTVAVDPKFIFSSPDPVSGKPICALYEMTSDDFFQSVDPSTVLGRRIDLAFLDGMHLCEFLLRDFLNTERFCKPNSIIVLHDCIPLEHRMAQRVPTGGAIEPHRAKWWTGDVWRAVVALKEYRPDLRVTALDAKPTGLVLITNLDPASNVLSGRYGEVVDRMLARSLAEYTLSRLYSELQVESTRSITTLEQISAKFWL